MVELRRLSATEFQRDGTATQKNMCVDIRRTE